MQSGARTTAGGFATCWSRLCTIVTKEVCQTENDSRRATRRQHGEHGERRRAFSCKEGATPCNGEEAVES